MKNMAEADKKLFNFYGKELILDLHNCDSSLFTRGNIENFFIDLCSEIDMERGDLYFWDDVGVPEEEKQTDPITKGTSAVQFILTSSIVIHTLDELENVYINLFSCKDFESKVVGDISVYYFDGDVVNRLETWRT